MLIKRLDDKNFKKEFSTIDWPFDINYLEITPSEMSFDDLDTGTEGGVLFNMIECIDFLPAQKGSVWFDINFPQKWPLSKDMIFHMYFSVDGNDPGKYVQIDMKSWVVNLGSSPDEFTPDLTTSISIVTNSNNMGKYSLNRELRIPANFLSSKDSIIICKLTRDGLGDSYNGYFKIPKILIRQI